MGTTMLAEAIQLAFTSPTRVGFVPVPFGDRHYVPAVQNRPGELDALRQASVEAWRRLTPLIEVVGEKQRRHPYKREAVAGWVRNLSEAVGTRPCFLDLLRLKADHDTETLKGLRPILSVIYEEARKRSLSFVPVVPVGGDASRAHVSFVRQAAAQDRRGVALRYKPLGLAFEPGATPVTVLEGALNGVGVGIGDADLVLDLEYLAPDRELHLDDVCGMLDEVAALGQWRSLILLASSIPESLGGTITEGTIGEIPRQEWALWRALKEAGRGRLPTFGDYVVQHPRPPHTTGGPSMRANIRYTAGGATLVARARGPVIVEGKEQYRELCQQLIAHPAFAGDGFSWGDRRIAACARGIMAPGWQNVWRGAGSSHHVEVVTRDVSS